MILHQIYRMFKYFVELNFRLKNSLYGFNLLTVLKFTSVAFGGKQRNSRGGGRAGGCREGGEYKWRRRGGKKENKSEGED